MRKFEFDADIREAKQGGAWIEFPYDAQEAFNTKGRVKVKATFDGVPYRGSLAPMGGKHVLGILKDIRQKLNKGIGDQVHVVLACDTEERVVELPEELQLAFQAQPPAKEAFGRLSYSQQRELAMHVGEAKKSETRIQRANKAVEKLMNP